MDQEAAELFATQMGHQKAPFLRIQSLVFLESNLWISGLGFGLWESKLTYNFWRGFIPDPSASWFLSF